MRTKDERGSSVSRPILNIMHNITKHFGGDYLDCCAVFWIPRLLVSSNACNPSLWETRCEASSIKTGEDTMLEHESDSAHRASSGRRFIRRPSATFSGTHAPSAGTLLRERETLARLSRQFPCWPARQSSRRARHSWALLRWLPIMMPLDPVQGLDASFSGVSNAL